MPTQVFINLPIKNLPASIAFFEKLGYSFNKQFTDDKAGCLVISDTIYAMLVTEPFFKTFTNKTIADRTTSVESITSLSMDSKASVDDIVTKAVAAGATEPHPPQDLGFMYSRGFEDLEGHLWDFFWMDPAHLQK